MINAAIIDDEFHGINALSRLLQKHCPEINLLFTTQQPEEASNLLNQHQPDLVFLDIDMPRLNGIALLQQLSSIPFKVIFTTAYDQYAIQAIRLNALDYLLKPIDTKRLSDAIQKLNLFDEREVISTENRVENRSFLSDNDQVFVKDGEKCWFVRLSEIRLFESVGNYARVFFGTNKPLILKSLNSLEERLDPKTFFRANRKHIVNLRMIEKVEPFFNGGLLLEIKGGEKIEVSRRQAVRFKEMMSL